MFEGSEEFDEAIRWFLSKSATDKARIIEDLSVLEEEEQKKFFRIVREVRRTLTICRIY